METPENIILADIPDNIALSYPPTVQKLFTRLEKIEQLRVENQKSADLLKMEIKTLTKLLVKYFTKSLKSEKTSKRKPCGFAVPTQVTAELCIFMEKEEGTLISRTEATKYLMKYIADNKLQNPDNKRIIVPNPHLYALLGDDSRNVDITHFTIQRFINLHFPKKNATVQPI